MDLVERAKMIFRQLEEDNPKAASEIARRAFHIYGLMSEVKD